MDTLQDFWKEVLSLCKSQVSEVIYNTWLTPLQLVKFENDTFVFCINSEFKKNIICEKFLGVIESSFEQLMGFPVKVDIIVDAASANDNSFIPTKPAETKPAVTSSESHEEKSSSDDAPDSLNPQLKAGYKSFTFDNFIVGKSNMFAYNVSVGVAQNPGTHTNPLLIYGRSGLGKTHLMLAILNEIKRKNPNYVIIYTTGENFMNEMVESIAKKTPDKFRNKYRNVDALLMDDVQFIQRGDAVQEEFFHTFNALYQNNKQIVLTSDVPPREMEGITERLKTRFEWGITADVQPPDFDTRKAIILRKCEQLNVSLSDEYIEMIAHRIKNNIRQLEGIVKKISAMTTAFGTPITLEQLKEIMDDVTGDGQPVKVTVEKVTEYVAKSFGVTPSDLKSEKRQNNINTARQIAMYVLKEVTDLTLQEIGVYFNKNHSTVIHALTAAQKKMDEIPSIKAIAMASINEFQSK